MSSHVIFLLLSLIFLNLNTSKSQLNKLQAFLQPLIKHKSSNLYYIPLSIGKGQSLPPLNLNLAVDIGGATPLLLTCATASKSPSYHTIRCNSTRCKYANANLTCSKNTLLTKNSICRKYISTSYTIKPLNTKLIRDIVSLGYTTNGVTVMDSSKDSTLTLTCIDDSNILKPLPSLINGAIGLAKTPLSLSTQLFSIHNIAKKIAFCLPSKPGRDFGTGDLFIGGGPYYYAPFPKDVSTILTSIPFITNVPSDEYFIDVKSIEIGGKVVPFDGSILGFNKNGDGGTKICTLAPYTVLHSSIYNSLVRAFVGVSKVVEAQVVKPFGVCFSSKGIKVPVIDLVFVNGVKWRIYESNSLVKVSKDVSCLGFLDGGLSMKNGMVIGGFQMEDNLVEFDLKDSKFSFSSSLLLYNTSCMHLSRLF